MEEPSNFTIHNLNDISLKEQDRVEKECYVKKYNDCINKIEETNRTGKKHCIYSVSMKDINPAYNPFDCVTYIFTTLRDKAQFDQLRIIPPRHIEVSWVCESIEKKKIKNLNIMYQEYVRPEKNIIKAPPIMWYGSRTRHENFINEQFEYEKYSKKEKSRRKKKKATDLKSIQDDAKQFLLN